MITTHPRSARRTTRRAPRSQDRVPVRFVFQGGDDLSTTDIAVLRFFVAAGIRPSCVVNGSGRTPDFDVYRAALQSD